MAKNEAKIKFTAETSEFNSAIKESNEEMSKLRAELKLNETEMQGTGTTVEGLQKKYKILSNQLEVSESKTEALRQKLEKAKQIFGENSTEANKLETQLLQAQTATEKLRQEVNNCSEALDKQKISAENSAEGFTVLKGAMADLLADGIEGTISAIGDIGTEAFTMANDVTQATNTFVAKTGESTASAEEFEDVMKNIYNNNFGESFEDISEAMSTVKTAMGDIGSDELEKLTTDALMLRDTFDMDVNESIRAVNSMMDQFGISADDAFNLIAQGAQNGLNQNGDLLDVLNEYSVQFENAGYSAEDMFNMLSNGVESGTWSVDKLGDAVKEFNIRMSDGSAKDAVEALGFSWESVSADWSKGGDSAKEVFNMLFNELDGLENTTEGYGIGVGLLGTMYEDLGQDAVLALSNTKGEISTTTDALEEINSVRYDDLGTAFEGIKRNLMSSVSEPLENDVLPILNDFAANVDWQALGESISSGITAGIEAIKSFAEGVKESITWMKEHQGVVIAVASVIGVLVTAITAYNVVQAVKAAMAAAEVTTVWGLVAAYWAQATAAMAALAPYILIVAAIAAVIAIIVLCIKYWDEIVAAVKMAWEKVKETLAVWGEWINTNVVQPIVRFFTNLWQSIKDGIAAVKQWFSEKFAQAKEAVLNAWSSVTSFFSRIWDGICNVFANIKNWFSNKFQSAKDGAVNAWSNIKDKFSSIKEKIASAFSNIKEKLSAPFEKARDAIKKVADKIFGFFKGEISMPKIKLPHFSISPSGWKIGDLLKGSIPKLGISWYADGGIMMKPTVFGMNGFNAMVGGEAGPEAILPIDRLEGYVADAVEKHMTVVNMDALAKKIEDLANRPIVLNVNGRQMALATAGDIDSVNGIRSVFKNRGLAVD